MPTLFYNYDEMTIL